MQFAYQNRNDPAYEALFNDLIGEVFGFTFADWHRLGVWDERYESFSLIENGVMLANICLFRTQLVLEGQRIEAFHLGAVSTRTARRGQGLSRRLMERVLERYPDSPMFLFANQNVLNFYPRFGFCRVYESSPVLEFRPNHPPVRRLALDDSLVRQFLERGRCGSARFYCANTLPIEWFHLLSCGDSLWHLPEIEGFAVAEQQGNELQLHYLSLPEGLPVEAALSYLPFSGVTRIRFGFYPDELASRCKFEPLLGGDESMFVRGHIPLPETYTFPALSKT